MGFFSSKLKISKVISIFVLPIFLKIPEKIASDYLILTEKKIVHALTSLASDKNTQHLWQF